MLELAVLGLLKERTMHGYELKKELAQKLGHFWQVSFGSLYPTLRKLEKRGAVEKVFDDDATSRRKNVYRITERGDREFLELIEDRPHSAWEEEKFPLRLAFFRYLKPELRIRLLERRKTYLQDKLTDLQESMGQARERIDGYTLSLLKHNLDVTAADIAWLDELISTERRSAAEATKDENVTPGAETSRIVPRPTGERAPARTRP